MKRDWSRFAPLGLILAGLAAFVSICIYIIVPKLSIWLQISLIVMVAGLLLFVALAPGQVRRAIKGRRARYGLNAVLLSLAFIGILVVINYLVFYNAKMNPKLTRWDLTENKSNTLATETLDALSKLPDVVHAQAFYSPRGDESTISATKTLLENFTKNAKGKFAYEFINWEEKRNLATQAGITNDGQVVLNLGDRKELVSVVDEQNITSALVKLIANEKQKVYFLQDEGEYNPNGTTDSESMSKVRDALEGKNYSVDTVKLVVDGMVPEDANIIIIAGPKQILSQASVDLLAKYLENGGSLIVLEGPMIDNSGAFIADPLVDYLAKTWGITMGNNVVVTVQANQPTLLAIAGSYGTHAITEKMGAYTPSFPVTRSVQASASASELSLTEIVYTPQYIQNCFPSCSWATTDINGLMAWVNGGDYPPMSSTDLLGPVPIAVAAENTTTKARVVVFGSSDFASNSYRTAGNQDLLLNAIDWSAKQEQLINLTAKETTDRTFVPSVIKYSNIVTNLVFLGSVILLPGAVLFAGVIAWVIRRKRG